jgi:DNA sulfur modification protein DndD
MEFTWAHVRNFKLLEDLEVNFSSDASRPLTVIRAENASGKTSLLGALQWGLWGERALDARGVRLSSVHWPTSEPCEIAVEIAFSHTSHMLVGQQQVTNTRRYRLRRSVTEAVVDGKSQRSAETVSLMEVTDSGFAPVNSPEAELEKILSIDLRGVFFTDGDRAMNFISSQLTRTDKRSQVRDAIKALLEIGVIEDAIKHVKAALARKRQETGDLGGANVAHQAEEVNLLTARKDALEEKKREAVAAAIDLGAQLEAAQRALEEALQRGNYEDLVRSSQGIKERKAGAEQMLTKLSREHQTLFSSRALTWSLVEPVLRDGLRVLNGLHDRGIIPAAAIGVLQDRLAMELCICGEPLLAGTRARKAVEDEIERQRASDANKQRLTRLFHYAQADAGEHDVDLGGWPAKLDNVIGNRVGFSKIVREAEQDLEVVEKQIAAVNLADVEEKRQLRKALASALAQQQEQQTRSELELAGVEARLAEAEQQHAEAMKRDDRLRRAQSQLVAAQDILGVLGGVMEELQGDYLERVSRRMDALFRSMIAADADLPEDLQLITGASITPEYDIVVHTVGNQTLDPDHELNGASQRALTFAFIWALTEVSDTVAPRVIDTPLGMMSGYVKRSVLNHISELVSDGQPDRQVVLFLTRSEIAQVEDLLDARAGIIFTLTNTAAGDLSVPSDDEHPRIVRCECNHRQVCRICSRIDDRAYNLVERTEV